MFEIKGSIGSAKCYAKTIEQAAIDQIKRMCDYKLTEGSNICIMPDVHAGAGCTIGTTMTITDKVCPNIVGVDIGCGMLTIWLDKKADELDLVKIDEAAHYIPSGMNVWEECDNRFDLSKLRCLKKLHDVDRLERSLGTLGGGNLFIEVDKDDAGFAYLVIHSGSRNLGKQVADIYQKIAIGLHDGRQKIAEEKREVIRSLKEAGRASEIQAAIKEIDRKYKDCGMGVPEDICWLYGKDMEDYLHDLKICQDFAIKNRKKMANIILERCGLEANAAFHTVHNYISLDEMILRKGSISARAGELVLIPINMRDGSVIAIGKGNPEWNCSAPHGAGRLMSRAEAKRTLNIEDYKNSMNGIYTTSVNEGTIDEAPMVYKPIDEIVEAIKDTVNIVGIIKPIYNFKAAEDEPVWRKK